MSANPKHSEVTSRGCNRAVLLLVRLARHCYCGGLRVTDRSFDTESTPHPMSLSIPVTLLYFVFTALTPCVFTCLSPAHYGASSLGAKTKSILTVTTPEPR